MFFSEKSKISEYTLLKNDFTTWNPIFFIIYETYGCTLGFFSDFKFWPESEKKPKGTTLCFVKKMEQNGISRGKLTFWTILIKHDVVV